MGQLVQVKFQGAVKFTLTESNIKLVERSVLHLGFKIGAWGAAGFKQKCFCLLVSSVFLRLASATSHSCSLSFWRIF
jgi:hypothetical protein